MSKSTSDAQGPRPLAVVHLNVPGALKARWVKASQRRGLKLTDYLLELIRRGETNEAFESGY